MQKRDQLLVRFSGSSTKFVKIRQFSVTVLTGVARPGTADASVSLDAAAPIQIILHRMCIQILVSVRKPAEVLLSPLVPES